MFTAFGRAGRKNADGTLTVTVEIVDDRTQKTVRSQPYSGTLQSIKAAILMDLAKLKDAENDLTVNEAVVNKILGSV